MDSDKVPEGLHVESGERRGELVIRDAQDHTWVTLHDGANGDPVEWRRQIADLVIDALQASDDESAVTAREDVKARLEYLRGELRAEQISLGELIELQGLVEFIDPGDVELLEAAGVPEFPAEEEA